MRRQLLIVIPGDMSRELEPVLLCSSHRPVQCPVASCGTAVAINTLGLHFVYDHAQVPTAVVRSGTPLSVSVHPRTVGQAKCLSLLRLEGRYRGVIAMDPCSQSLALPLMTARFGSVMVFWLADVCSDDVIYAIEAASDDGHMRVAFEGPVVGLVDTTTPGDVISHGDALLLSEGQIKHLGATKGSFNLTVTVY